jgi:hypothetical protein
MTQRNTGLIAVHGAGATNHIEFFGSHRPLRSFYSTRSIYRVTAQGLPPHLWARRAARDGPDWDLKIRNQARDRGKRSNWFSIVKSCKDWKSPMNHKGGKANPEWCRLSSRINNDD